MIEVKLNARDVERGFDRMRSQHRRAQLFFAAYRRPVRDEIAAHGRAEEGPEGRWQPRKPRRGTRKVTGRTTKKGVKLGLIASKPLLGKLTRSVRQRSNAYQLLTASPVSWADVHQKGGTVGRGSVIPARPFLWFSDHFMKDASRDYAAFVANAFSGRTVLP